MIYAWTERAIHAEQCFVLRRMVSASGSDSVSTQIALWCWVNYEWLEVQVCQPPTPGIEPRTPKLYECASSTTHNIVLTVVLKKL